jgi:hypothetical protein
LIQGLCRRDIRVFQPVDFPVHGLVFLKNFPVALVRDEADPVPDVGKAEVGVVLPVQKPVLGAGRHDAVRFVRALCHQVVDERADVPLVPADDHGLFSRSFSDALTPATKP